MGRRKLTQQSPMPVERGKLRVDMLKAHQVYMKNGVRVPGVTTIIGMMDKPALVRWANRMGLEGKDTSKVVEHAADIGTVTHARIEAMLRDKDFDGADIAPPVLEASVRGFDRFKEWWDAQGLTVVATEKQMVSKRWDCGGTLDVVASSNRSGSLRLIDIKSSSGIYKEMRIQACAYAEIFDEHGEDHEAQIDEVWIVRVGKEEDDVIEPVQIFNREQCVRCFDAMVALYPLWTRLR